MVSRTFLIRLIWSAVSLAVGVAVIAGVSVLLGEMNDEAGAVGTGWFALALGVLWIVNLVVLVLALAVHSVSPPQDSPSDGDDSAS